MNVSFSVEYVCSTVICIVPSLVRYVDLGASILSCRPPTPRLFSIEVAESSPAIESSMNSYRSVCCEYCGRLSSFGISVFFFTANIIRPLTTPVCDWGYGGCGNIMVGAGSVGPSREVPSRDSSAKSMLLLSSFEPTVSTPLDSNSTTFLLSWLLSAPTAAS